MKTGFLALFRGSVMMFLCIINISAVIEKRRNPKSLVKSRGYFQKHNNHDNSNHHAATLSCASSCI